jgi:hypothetical protein
MADAIARDVGMVVIRGMYCERVYSDGTKQILAKLQEIADSVIESFKQKVGL